MVQRNPQIVLRQIAAIEFELPSQLVVKPRTTHIIGFKLTTPHPQDEWRFTVSDNLLRYGGSLYLAGKNKIVITLPIIPGSYTVRLSATNQRGVSVTSNPMSIYSDTWSQNSKPDQRMRNIFQSQEEIEELEKACACFNLPCSPETVKNRGVYHVEYRKLALKYHPDKHLEKSGEKFKAVMEANAVLNKATEDYNK